MQSYSERESAIVAQVIVSKRQDSQPARAKLASTSSVAFDGDRDVINQRLSQAKDEQEWGTEEFRSWWAGVAHLLKAAARAPPPAAPIPFRLRFKYLLPPSDEYSTTWLIHIPVFLDNCNSYGSA